MKRAAVWAGMIVIGCLVTIAVTGAAFYAWAQSDTGRSWLAARVAHALSEPGRQEFSIGRLTGNLFARFELENVSARDTQGAWLDIRSLKVEWRPRDLLRRVIHLQDLEARGVVVHRAPSGNDDEKQATFLQDLAALRDLQHVRVDRLSVEPLTLGKDLFGEAADLRIRGQVDARPDDVSRITVTAERTDGPTDKLQLEATYQAADQNLDIDFRMTESAGGLIARVADFDGLPAIDAHFKGQGPLTDWRGKAAFSAGQVASLTADVALRSGADFGFDVTGKTKFGETRDALLARLSAGAHDFKLSGSYGPSGQLTVGAFHWNATAFTLALEGQLNTTSLAVDARLSGRTTGGDPLPIGLDRTTAQDVAVTATVAGTLREAQLDLDVNLQRIASPDVAIETFTGKATLQLKLAGDGQVDLGDIDAAGSLRGLSVPHAPKLGDILGDALQWRIAGDVDMQRAKLRIKTLAVEGAPAALNATGAFDYGDGNGAVNMSLAIPALAHLRSATGMPLAGRLDLSAEVSIKGFGDHVVAKVEGGAEEFTSGQPVADALLTRAPKLKGEIAAKNGALTLRGVAMTSASASLGLDGTISQDGKADAQYRLDVTEGTALPVDPSVVIRCACKASGKLTGALEDPGVEGDIEVSALDLEPVPLRRITLKYELDKLVSALNGSVRVSAHSDMGVLTAKTNVRLSDSELRLTDLALDGDQANLKGTLAIPVSGAPATGDLEIAASELRPWLRHAALEGSGKATARVSLRPDGARQKAEIHADVTNLWLDGVVAGDRLQVARITGKFEAADLRTQDGLSIDIDARDAVAGPATLKRLRLTAKGSPKRITANFDLAGDWVEPLSMKAAMEYAATGAKQTITVTALQGKLLGEPLRLRRTLRVGWEPDSITIDPAELTFGGGQIRSWLRADGTSLDGSLTVTALPVKPFDRLHHTGLLGAVDGTVTVQGPLKAPTGKLMLKSQKLRFAKLSGDEKVGFSIDGTWRDGRLRLNGEFSSPSAPPAVLDVDIPLVIDPVRRVAEVPPREPITGTVTWQGEIATIWPLLPLGENQLSGKGRIDARLSGTLEAPKLQGQASIQDGVYESLELGTILRPIDAAVAFDGDAAKISKFSAKDGGNGTISVTGQVGFDPSAHYPFDVSTVFKNVALVRRDDVDATASGEVSVKGSLAKAKVLARLTTETVEVNIPERLPPNVVNLHVTDEGQTGAEEDGSAKRARPATFDPALDVTVDMPRRVFIRGRGIDSEWKGDVTVGGTAGNPFPSGTMSLVRGQMSVVGKTFKLEDGQVILDDRKGAEPRIYVRAVYTGADFTATARASGPISKPTITLSSSPELPQDEIVSRILFNKSATRLNGFEAAQLALALADLSGSDGGVGNVMSLARRTLGVDVLRVDSRATKDGDRPVLEAGKYLTDDVYLDVKQGATPESSSVGVGVDLTPHVSVESDVRQSGASDLGVKFKLDY